MSIGRVRSPTLPCLGPIRALRGLAVWFGPSCALCGLAVASGAAAACSSNGNLGPPCANESSATPFGDAGVLPLRALPAGHPCATNAVCTATIDDCPSDWPAGADAPSTSNETPFQCTCPGGVWQCAATSTTVGSCSITDGGPPGD
jgi:hypothetical protein